MDLHYISDKEGKHTAIVIPIEEWNNMTSKHEDLKTFENPKRKPSDFRGSISKESANIMLQHVEKSRKEWGRDIS
ncbi:MAG: hypothetical protein U5N85_22320 [Arcicella sp.]|nr:hypothetical protein [Arcicella sp.]